MSLQNKLTPVDRQYIYEDVSGYKFIVKTTFKEDRGWEAGVNFYTGGMIKEEDAIRALLNPIRHFVRVAEEE